MRENDECVGRAIFHFNGDEKLKYILFFGLTKLHYIFDPFIHSPTTAILLLNTKLFTSFKESPAASELHAQSLEIKKKKYLLIVMMTFKFGIEKNLS